MNAGPVNLYRLYVFQLVARRLSFSEAADDLHTSQPNISKHVRQLEGELGISLFDRMGGRVALTDAGRIVFDHAERLFRTVEEMRRALNELEGLERGYLRLGASSTPGVYLLPPLLAGFRKQYPKLEIRLHLGNSQEIIQMVLSDQADLGIVEGYEMKPGLQVQPFEKDVLVLIAPANHPLAGKENISPADLMDETFIFREAGSGTREGMGEMLEKIGVAPENSLEICGCEGVKRVVAAGLGLSFVSQRAIELEVAQGMLVILEGQGLHAERTLSIVNHKDRRLSAAALAFLARLRKIKS
ncbi:MAG: LysR family transcriptional regulator [Chloroflexota bacterium]